jgi:hypothetical protein
MYKLFLLLTALGTSLFGLSGCMTTDTLRSTEPSVKPSAISESEPAEMITTPNGAIEVIVKSSDKSGGDARDFLAVLRSSLESTPNVALNLRLEVYTQVAGFGIAKDNFGMVTSTINLLASGKILQKNLQNKWTAVDSFSFTREGKSSGISGMDVIQARTGLVEDIMRKIPRSQIGASN